MLKVRLYVPGIIGIGYMNDRLNYKVWWLGPLRRPWLSVHTDDRKGKSVYSMGRRVRFVKPLNKGGEDA